MLKNRYDEILIGLNLTSLMRGLISLRNKRSVLLIDDRSFKSTSIIHDYISELEIQSILRTASVFNISELASIRKFLRPAVIDLNTDKVRLRIGGTPFENLRELLRKYPELIEKNDLDLVYLEGEREFDHFFLGELKRFEDHNFENYQREKNVKYELSSGAPRWFKNIYQRFFEIINLEYAQNRSLKFNSLLHLMSICFEEKMKARLNNEELAYYFFKLLSPQYRLQDFILLAQLKRRLIIDGGDYKESKIQYWQFYQGHFENLLLASFEGVISASKVLFFTHIPEDLPFSLKTTFPLYRTVQMHVDKSSISAYPPHHLVVQTKETILGSDKPFTQMSFDSSLSMYQMPYLRLPASKATFYKNELSVSFKADSQNLPFHSDGAVFEETLSDTLDLRGLLETKEFSMKSNLNLELEYEGKKIGGFEYWGTHKFYCLGYLGLLYGLGQN